MSGSQCPIAEVASGAVQSPVACRCAACTPGVAPDTVSVNETLVPDSVKLATPVTVLALLDSSFADATFPEGASPGHPSTTSAAMGNSC